MTKKSLETVDYAEVEARILARSPEVGEIIRRLAAMSPGPERDDMKAKLHSYLYGKSIPSS